uniref:Matrin-type domain-containing protein n=1 Tax=Plectus sambesii TaxID=2011161 RepID=A0A914VXL0_9BILA
MAGPSGVYGAGVGDHRRKWDTTEFEIKAQERLALEREEREEKEAKERGEKPTKPKEKVKRELLKPREYKVDLEAKIGKSVVINKTTPSGETGGYYCDVCDCVVKDSINFLDHINGKNHQRNMGMSMKVKRSTLDDVRERFAVKKQEKEQAKKEYDLKERLVEVREEEQRMAEYRRQKKVAARKRKRGEGSDDEQPPEVDAGMAAMMGFGGFGTSKKVN